MICLVTPKQKLYEEKVQMVASSYLSHLLSLLAYLRGMVSFGPEPCLISSEAEVHIKKWQGQGLHMKYHLQLSSKCRVLIKPNFRGESTEKPLG